MLFGALFPIMALLTMRSMFIKHTFIVMQLFQLLVEIELGWHNIHLHLHVVATLNNFIVTKGMVLGNLPQQLIYQAKMGAGLMFLMIIMDY